MALLDRPAAERTEARRHAFRTMAEALAPALRGDVRTASYTLPRELMAATAAWTTPPALSPVPSEASRPPFTTLPRLPDLFAQIPANGPMVAVPSFTPPAAGQGAAAHLPGAAKRNAVLTFTGQNEPMAGVGTWVDVSDELADDSTIMAWLDVLLPYLVALGQEDELINGDGTGAHLRGFLIRPEIPVSTAAAGGTAGVILAKMRAQALLSGLVPDFYVVNPVTWGTALDDASGLAGRLGDDGQTLDGCTIIQTASIAEGKYLVGASAGAVLMVGSDIRIDVTNAHDVNFTKNITTIRAAGRLALGVIMPTAFVKK